MDLVDRVIASVSADPGRPVLDFAQVPGVRSRRFGGAFAATFPEPPFDRAALDGFDS